MRMAIVRLLALTVLLINQCFVIIGWSPIPYSEDQIYEVLSSASLVVVSFWAWWKNNSITDEALEADKYKEELKKQNKE